MDRNEITHEITQFCDKNFDKVATYLSKMYSLELYGITGLFRDGKGNYTPWGKIISNKKYIREKYNILLKNREKIHARFATLLFLDNKKNEIPYIIFREDCHKKIRGIEENNAQFIEFGENNRLIDNSIDYIVINNQKFEEKYRIPSNNIDNLKHDFENTYSSDRKFLEYLKTINALFKKYNKDSSIDINNFLGFLNVTSLLSNDVSYLIYIPFVPFKNYVNGAIFLYLNSKINEINLNELEEISWYFHGMIQKYYFEEISNKIKLHAIKSAKAAIMARNMSHNLGSHVLAYIRHKLNDVQTIIKENSLKNLLPATTNDILNNDNQSQLEELIDHLHKVIRSAKKEEESIPFDIAKAENIELPFLIGLGYLINYLQERQDFIATISTNHIPYSVPVNFKDTVYDELNHDYKAIRHKDSRAYLYKGDNLLIDNIARSEGFERDDILISYRKFSGLNETERNENKDKRYEDLSKVYVDFDELNKINVALPGGAVGRQAFFSIIENFIRNSAKHSGKGNDHDKKFLEIKMDLIDLDDEKELEKYNNREEKIDTNIIHDDTQMNGYYRVELSDNRANFELAENAIQEALNDPFINEDGSLKEDHKGIKEMRISATWLRFLEDENILEDENYPPVFQLANKGGNVCYVFYLLKPKDLLFVTEDKNLIDKYKGNNGNGAWEPEFNKNGWKLITYEDFDFSIDSRYRLIVFDKNIDEDKEVDDSKINETRKYCHSRITVTNNLSKERIDIDKKLSFDQLDAYTINKIEVFNHFHEKFIKNNIISELPVIKIIESDHRKLKKVEPQYNSEKIKIKDIEDGDNNLIVYKDHFDTEAKFNAFEKHLEKTLFVEAVSGNNSSDRLIRKTDFDKHWYLNMVESALTKIAIIDERLWSYFSQIEEDDFFENERDIKSFIANLKERHQQNVEEKIGKLASNKNVHLSTEEIQMIIDDEADFENFNDNLKKKIDNLKSLQFNSHNYKVLRQKRIEVYNILEKNGQFDIIEMNTQKKDSINKLILEKDIENPDSNFDFDFICIHQGLIDKIYTQYSSKTNQTIEKADLKGKILDNIKDIFKAKNIVVHSGRSRPSSSDLPRRFAFLQYSAISHAVKDCKHSLTELLYSARYE
jgi:hypothetical protein